MDGDIRIIQGRSLPGREVAMLRRAAMGIVVTAAIEHRASLMRPALSPAEYLMALKRNGLPQTAEALAGYIR